MRKEHGQRSMSIFGEKPKIWLFWEKGVKNTPFWGSQKNPKKPEKKEKKQFRVLKKDQKKGVFLSPFLFL